MIYEFGPIRGDVDGALHDDTTYRFADDRSEDLLTLTYERTPGGVEVGALVASKLERLAAVYGSAFEVISLEGIGTRVGHAAFALARLATADPIAVCLAYSESGPLYLQFSGGESAPSLLRHLLGSLRNRDDQSTPSAPGFVRGAAGALAFDVPANYSMPDTFRFSGDSMVLECAIQTGRAWRAPTADEVAYISEGRLELESHENPRELFVDDAPATFASWVFARSGRNQDSFSEPYTVKQLRVELRNGASFHVRGRVQSANTQEFARIWAHFVGSLRRKTAE